MPATLLFYRAADSDTRPEYFGAVPDGSLPAVHYQVQLGDDGLPDFTRWTVERLGEARFWSLEHTRPPYAPPCPIDQAEFLGLLKTFILPPLPL